MGDITINFEEVSTTYLKDFATGGKCYNVYLKTKEYIDLMKDIYDKSNEFQREVIKIKRSLVYRKLVRDLLKGVVIPTISVYIDEVDGISNPITFDKNNLKILDGLQRTNCILYAHRIITGEVIDSSITEEIGNMFSLQDFENSLIRLEIWTKMTVNGIMYKMVSLNAGQTPMKIEHQFEVLELPLKKELNSEDILLFRENEEDKRKEKGGFRLYLVVEGVLAYSMESISPRKQELAISMLDRIDVYKKERESTFLKTDYVIKDLIWVIKEVHSRINTKYSNEYLKEFRNIISEQESFFIPFMAALGKVRNKLDEQRFEESKENLIKLIDCDRDDPLDLIKFSAIKDNFKTGIGMRIRRLVFNAFFDFFMSKTACEKIDWDMANELA